MRKQVGTTECTDQTAFNIGRNSSLNSSGAIRIGELIRQLERHCAKTIRSAHALRLEIRREQRHSRSAAGLKLTWVASLKQWRKRRNIDGKTNTFYLGTGKGKDDNESYAAAMKK